MNGCPITEQEYGITCTQGIREMILIIFFLSCLVTHESPVS